MLCTLVTATGGTSVTLLGKSALSILALTEMLLVSEWFVMVLRCITASENVSIKHKSVPQGINVA